MAKAAAATVTMPVGAPRHLNSLQLSPDNQLLSQAVVSHCATGVEIPKVKAPPAAATMPWGKWARRQWQAHASLVVWTALAVFIFWVAMMAWNSDGTPPGEPAPLRDPMGTRRRPAQ